MNRPISIRSFATAALALSLGPAAFGQARDLDTPAAELASFTLAEGFTASLFASETDGVVKPIQIRFDARGRLWVIGSTVYPQIQPGQDPQDKVLILEDTDGDGRSDKTTVFAEGLMIPTGLETIADGTGCYVGHGPELLLLKDTDGDDRADQRTVVLRGFGTADNHQNINSFTWDPNGNLWFSQGPMPGSKPGLASSNSTKPASGGSTPDRGGSKDSTAAPPTRKTHGDSSSATGENRWNSQAIMGSSFTRHQDWSKKPNPPSPPTSGRPAAVAR